MTRRKVRRIRSGRRRPVAAVFNDPLCDGRLTVYDRRNFDFLGISVSVSGSRLQVLLLFGEVVDHGQDLATVACFKCYISFFLRHLSYGKISLFVPWPV